MSLSLTKLSVLAILNRKFIQDQPGLDILCKLAIELNIIGFYQWTPQ
jgi:hypothetical protein